VRRKVGKLKDKGEERVRKQPLINTSEGEIFVVVQANLGLMICSYGMHAKNTSKNLIMIK